MRRTARSSRFWWYLLRNWNQCNAFPARNFLTFWWYLLRNWNFSLWLPQRAAAPSFDDTYWGIETKAERQNDRSDFAFDDTYWGIETECGITSAASWSNFWWYLLRNWNSPWQRRTEAQARFWWYLLRNWNSLLASYQARFCAFWWYLLRNWNSAIKPKKVPIKLLLMIPIEELKHRKNPLASLTKLYFWWYLLRNWNLQDYDNTNRAPPFWWYLLRNWNPSAGCNLPQHSAFDDTYWGIETTLLWWSASARRTFDDTYWGIETPNLCIISNSRSLFWWYLLRNWNTGAILLSTAILTTFDDTYWGIETIQRGQRAGIYQHFWWYLLRNWNSLRRRKPYCLAQPFWWYLLRNWNDAISGLQKHLLMIPIEELKPGETSITIDHSICLLMIPIEELKRDNDLVRQVDLRCVLMIFIEKTKYDNSVVRWHWEVLLSRPI